MSRLRQKKVSIL